MEQHRLILGAAVLGLLGWLYYDHSKVKNPVTNVGALTGHFQGYAGMMKLSPHYYNGTAMEGSDFNPQMSDGGMQMINTPWTLPAVQGNGSQIAGGQTDWGDAYSTRLSNVQLQERVVGSHL